MLYLQREELIRVALFSDTQAYLFVIFDVRLYIYSLNCWMIQPGRHGDKIHILLGFGCYRRDETLESAKSSDEALNVSTTIIHEKRM